MKNENMQKKVMQKVHQILTNQCCADCGNSIKDSPWASLTFGVFLCIECAGIHRQFGVNASKVKSVCLDVWTDQEATLVVGNDQVKANFGGAMKLVQGKGITMAERENFIRQKYGITSKNSSSETSQVAAQNIEKAKGNTENTSESDSVKSSNSNSNSKNGVVDLTKRFVNAFVVIGRGNLIQKQNFDKTTGPEDVLFQPIILDTYPIDTLSESPVPSHIAQFAFPEGFALSNTYINPLYFSFVLTNVNGIKIYASALRFYEELNPFEVMTLFAPASFNINPKLEVVNNNNNNTSTAIQNEIPKWAQDLSSGKNLSSMSIYCPKCILVTSHYPFYNGFKQFLQQVYRLSLSTSPMPIERYIGNFVCEIPLPPQGRIQVQLTLPEGSLIVCRPPKNHLPQAEFSFRPLFHLLDIPNVLEVITCLLLEQKVAICSRHISLLTPIAEALLCLLFPFIWQGAYIPVLPSSLLDVIDAPVPFLVGVHSKYLSTPNRATEVFYIDLDHNRIIPQVDENGKEIINPKLPERECAKLRAKLFEFANVFDPYAAEITQSDLAFPNEEYMQPIGNFASERGHTVPVKQQYTNEYDIQTQNYNTVDSSFQHHILHSSSNTTINSSSTSSYRTSNNGQRKSSFSTLNTALSSNRILKPVSSLAHTLTYYGNFNSLMYSSSSSNMTMEGSDTNSSSTSMKQGQHTTEHRVFDADAIRNAFLRLFVSIFKRYASYLNMSKSTSTNNKDPIFDSNGFLRDTYDTTSRTFLTTMISSQMFQRFCEDRVYNNTLPEVIFFDQAINQKLNRSLSLNKKNDVSFLEDKSDQIRETFVAPPPSNLGLPDNGTVYKYKCFPRFKMKLFGTIRRPSELFTTREQLRSVTLGNFHQQVYSLSTCMKGVCTWEYTRRLITQSQALYRMHYARKKYQQQYKAICCIQRHWVANLKRKKIQQVYRRVLQMVIRIQTYYRRYYQHTLFHKQQQAILKLQTFMKSYYYYQRFQHIRQSIIILQSYCRTRQHVHRFQHLKHLIVFVQSKVRGVVTRKKAYKWRLNIMEELRTEMFALWKTNHIPLIYRSKFWIMYQSPDYLCIGIHKEEIQRLNAIAKYTPNVSTNVTSHSIKVNTNIDYTQEDILSPESKSRRNQIMQNYHSNYEMAFLRLEEEQLYIYDQLKHHMKNDIKFSFYTAFNMNMNAKKKKRKFVKMLWNEYKHAQVSAEIILSIGYGGMFSTSIETKRYSRICQDLVYTVNAAMTSLKNAEGINTHHGGSFPYASSVNQNKKSKTSTITSNNNKTIKSPLIKYEALAYQNHTLEIQLAKCQRELQEFKQQVSNNGQLSTMTKRSNQKQYPKWKETNMKK